MSLDLKFLIWVGLQLLALLALLVGWHRLLLAELENKRLRERNSQLAEHVGRLTTILRSRNAEELTRRKRMAANNPLGLDLHKRYRGTEVAEYRTYGYEFEKLTYQTDPEVMYVISGFCPARTNCN